MKMFSRVGLRTMVAFVLAAGAASATHTTGCLFESADPSTYHEVAVPDGPAYYVEERERGPNEGDPPSGYDVPPPITPPPPGWGFLFGGGTWVYEEANTLPGLQRDGLGQPGCIPSEPLPCLSPFRDPVSDVDCGHGPDEYVHGFLNVVNP